jgi:hypothetical protein
VYVELEGIPVPEGEANARLMVAAADLLDALCDTADEIDADIEAFIEGHTIGANGDVSTLDADERVEYDRLCAIRDKARAAIAKATQP